MAAALSTLLGVCLFASVPMAAAGVATPPTPSGLSAQAKQLESQVVENATSLHAMADEAASDHQRLVNDDNQIASDQSTLQGLQEKLAQAAATLRSIALKHYMQDTSESDLNVFWGSPQQVATMATYEQLATTAESNAVAAYLQDQGAVQRQQQMVMAERAAANSAYSSAQAQYAALQSAAQAMQGALTEVQQEQADLAREQAALAAQRQAAAVRQGAPAAVPLTVLASSGGSQSSALLRLRQCESGGNYGDNTGNGYYGAYQFSASTWQGLGYSGLPSQASPSQQDQAALSLQQSDGWSQWPECAAMLGLGG